MFFGGLVGLQVVHTLIRGMADRSQKCDFRRFIGWEGAREDRCEVVGGRV